MLASNWILIFWLWAGNGYVPATAVFKDKPACEAALAATRSLANWNFRNGFCASDRTLP